MFSENFHVRLGYDFLTRRDLQPTSRPGTIGISWGVGFKIKKISINYSNAKYHFSGASNTITITKKIGKTIQDEITFPVLKELIFFTDS